MQWRLGMMLAATLAGGQSHPATARCLFFCADPEIIAPDKAAAVFARDIGAALPEGVAVVGMLEGGFQERFIQVRLRATPAGLDTLLGLRKLTRVDLKSGGAVDLGPEQPDWWDVAKAKNLRAANFGGTTLANLWIGVADDPVEKGVFAVYFFGFET